MTDIKPKRKMKPGGGKAKGSSFEAKVAKQLSAALPINFIKSPGSGARIGGQNFATVGAMMGEEVMKLFNADVVPINEKEVGYAFNFSVECKSYAEADNFTSLVSGSANVWKWIEESIVDAAKIGREPILIFKWNRTPTFVAVLSDDKCWPIEPRVTLKNSKRSLDVHLFDDLLLHPDFWVTKT